MSLDTQDWDWSQIRRHCLREARRHTANAADAEDAAQAAVLRAWRGRDALTDSGALWCWLSRISRNEALRLYERRRPEPRAEVPDGTSVGDLSETVALRVDVRRAVRELSPSDRRLLELRYADDLTCAAAAGRVGIELATAKVRLHRARRRLARALASAYGA
jgi:RNA polymerase sigma-70 factor (ECF subfamily)